MDDREWPILDQAYRSPKIREKLLVLGAHHAWINSELSVSEQTKALWKTYPKGALETLLYEIAHKDADDFNGLGDRHDVPPVWSKDGTRVGGYGKLDQIVDSSTEYKKLKALLSGMAAGTCAAYVRGWRHWAQYCNLRGRQPWIEVKGHGRGEYILDFIMFENTVM